MDEVRGLVAVPFQEVKMARFEPTTRELINIVGGDPLRFGDPHRVGPTGELAGWHGYVNLKSKAEGGRFNPLATALARAAGGFAEETLFGTVVFLGNTATRAEADVPEPLLTLGQRLGLWRPKEAR